MWPGWNANGPDGALVVLDLDGLKHINDTYGHATGDRAIVIVADILRRRLRVTDTVARVGGDEFAVIVPASTRAAPGESPRLSSRSSDASRRPATTT